MTLRLIRRELVNPDHTIRNHPGFRLRSQSRRIAVLRRKGREIHLARRVEPVPWGNELSYGFGKILAWSVILNVA